MGGGNGRGQWVRTMGGGQWVPGMGVGNGLLEWAAEMARGSASAGAGSVEGARGACAAPLTAPCSGSPRVLSAFRPPTAKVQPMPKTPITVLDIRDRIAKNLGAAFRQARACSGLTQAQLGAHLDVSAASISDVESGKQLITLERLVLFCELFGNTPTDVLLNTRG